MLKLLLAAAAVLTIAAPAAAQTDPNKLFADSKVVVRDRFSDEVVGKGPDLVFIPGLASSRATWRATAERLRGKYRLHLIQVAGFAGEPSRANAEGEIVVPTAEAIDAYLVQQKLTPATVVGHSLGGTMILYLAETHSEHLKKALIVDALPFFSVMTGGPAATVDSARPGAEQMRAAILKPNAGEYERMTAPQMAQMVGGEDGRRAVVAWSLATDRKVMAQALYDDLLLDLRPGLAAIKAPIVLLYPDNAPNGAQPARTDAIYGALFAGAPAIRIKRVDASRHFIMLDQPQAFAEALDAFLRS